MIRTNGRLRLCTALLILNLAFIWGNSLLPGNISGAISDWVRDLLALLFGSQPDDGVGGGLLRKLAHFTEFTALGMCLRWLFGMLRQKALEHLTFPFIAGITAACIDETIQVFVPGRGPGIKDVGIDTLGVILGIMLLSLIHAMKRKKSHNVEETKDEETACFTAGADHDHGSGSLPQ